MVFFEMTNNFGMNEKWDNYWPSHYFYFVGRKLIVERLIYQSAFMLF